MKFTLTSLAFLIIAVSVSGCQGKGKIFDEAIRNLDRTIADEKAILRLKESRADSLRRECRSSADAASRFLTVKALYEEYSRYDIDSAFYYVHLNREIAGKSGKPEMIFDADLDLADRYRISGMFNDALEVVDAMDTIDISDSRKYAYYHLLEKIYHGLYRTSKDPVSRKRHREKSLYYNQICPKASNEPIPYLIDRATASLNKGEQAEARKMLQDFLQADSISIDDKASLHFWLAKTYRAEGDIDNEILESAISADCDRKIPVKASRSLINLARRLFETGDTGHAFKYIVTAYEDATQADAKIALGEIGEFLPQIISAYEEIQHRGNNLLKYLLTISLLFVLCLGLMLSIIYADRNQIRKMQRKIQQDNDEIRKINEKLERRIMQIKETNQIKDAYIGRYMLMFSEHINSLERYRSWLRVKAKTCDMQQMQQALRSDDPIDTERKVLFDEFDETFLALFPNFVSQLNGLLKEEFRIGQNLKPGKLSNELRIFALIRLGVSDSAAIAQFLKKSPSTIYNYRVKLRNGALGERENFEKQLLEIG